MISVSNCGSIFGITKYPKYILIKKLKWYAEMANPSVHQLFCSSFVHLGVETTYWHKMAKAH